MAEIKSLSIKHDAIMDWLLANPFTPLSEAAVHFGITQSWLSTVIHSDIFQARYRERMGSESHDERIFTLREKTIGITHAALDRLGEKLGVIEDPQLLLDVASKGLKALGYGAPKAPGAPVQITLSVPPDVIEAARKRYEEHCAANKRESPEVVDGEFRTLDASGP